MDTPLTLKLRRAKNRAYRKVSQIWKYFAKLLRNIIRNRKQKIMFTATLMQSKTTAESGGATFADW